MNLVWNEFMDNIIGGKVEFENVFSKLADDLNKQSFTKEMLNENFTLFLNQKEYQKDIKRLFYEQMDYYNSKITVVANSSATHYIKENILKNENVWEHICFKGEEEYLKVNNFYKNKLKNSYVYLASRYFDGRVMNQFSKNLFVKDMKKFISFAYR